MPLFRTLAPLGTAAGLIGALALSACGGKPSGAGSGNLQGAGATFPAAQPQITLRPASVRLLLRRRWD